MALPAAAILGAAGITGLLSGASSALGSYKQYKYQKKLQQQAAQLNYDFGKKTALNQYAWTRKSLEKANYNPMLAVSQGPVGMSGGYTSSGSAQSEDYSGSISSALDFARYYNEKKLNEANVGRTNAETEQITIDNYFAPQVKEATIANIQSATALQEQQTLAQIITNKYLPDSLKSQIYHNIQTANASLTQAQSSMIQVGTNSAVSSDKVYDNKRYISWSNKHPYLYSFDKTMRRYGAGIIAGVGGYYAAKVKAKTRPRK